MRPYYQDEAVTLYNCDFRDANIGTVDCIIADPPYAQTSLDWDRWLPGWTYDLRDWSRSMWVFGSVRMFLENVKDFGHEWKMSQDIVWEKHNGSSFHSDRFRRVHESAVHFYQGDWASIYHVTPVTMDATAKTVRRKQRPSHMGHIDAGHYVSHDGGPRLQRSVLFVPSMHGNAENETQKPEGIVSPLVEYACPPGGTILSPFAGSGTDLVVAKRSGRRAIGFEKREQQCEVAARRLSQGVLYLPATIQSSDKAVTHE